MYFINFKIVFALLFLFYGMIFSQSKLSVLNPDGSIKNVIYQKAPDSSFVVILSQRDNLNFESTLWIGSREYKIDKSAYFLVVPSNMSQKINVWLKSDINSKIELKVPKLQIKQGIEFSILEELQNQVKIEGSGFGRLETRPTAAQYEFADEERSGTTPMKTTKLKAGLHRILLRKDRYKPKDIILEINKDDTTSKFVELEQQWANLTFLTETPNAKLLLNGKQYDLAYGEPLKFEGLLNGLLEGRYNYSIEANHYQTFADHLVLEAGEVRLINKNLPLIDGDVDFESSPASVHIYNDTEYWGLTPFTKKNVKLGSYVLTARREGYEDVKTTINISKPNESVHINLKLQEGRLTVYCLTGSQVYLDENGPKECGQSFDKVKAGILHKLRVEHPDFESFIDEIYLSQEEMNYTANQVGKPFLISVSGNEPNSQVYVNDELIGNAPIMDYEILGDGKRFNLKVTKPNYSTFESEIEATPNGKKLVVFNVDNYATLQAIEENYRKFENAMPIEFGFRTDAFGDFMLGLRQRNFVMPRGFSVLNQLDSFPEFHVGIEELQDKFVGLTVRANIAQYQLGIQFKDESSAFVAQGSIVAMFAPTFQVSSFTREENGEKHGFSFLLKETPDYDIYMRKGIYFDLFALKFMAGYNYSRALSLYVGWQKYLSVVRVGQASAVLKNVLVTNEIPSNEQMTKDINDEESTWHPFTYSSVSAGFNIFMPSRIKKHVAGELRLFNGGLTIAAREGLGPQMGVSIFESSLQLGKLPFTFDFSAGYIGYYSDPRDVDNHLLYEAMNIGLGYRSALLNFLDIYAGMHFVLGSKKFPEGPSMRRVLEQHYQGVDSTKNWPIEFTPGARASLGICKTFFIRPYNENQIGTSIKILFEASSDYGTLEYNPEKVDIWAKSDLEIDIWSPIALRAGFEFSAISFGDLHEYEK